MVTISADDPRSIQAVELAAGASGWIKIRGKDGRPLAFGVPSRSTPGKFWLANTDRCQCPDFQFHPGPCAHVLAVRLRCELAKAEGAHRKRRSATTKSSDVSMKPERRSQNRTRLVSGDTRP